MTSGSPQRSILTRIVHWDFRERADVLVRYGMIADMPEEEKRANLLTFVESGEGIVVLHHAIIDHNSWPWWYEEVVGDRYLL